MDLDLWLTSAAALWGAAAGLLVPRVAYRLAVAPEEPWRGRCPAAHPITGVGRGWLGLARCGVCVESRYGPSAPLYATLNALVCAALALATGTRPELAVWLVLAPIALLLAVVDLAVQRLPDVVTLPLAVAAVALLGGASLVPEHAGDWGTALLGMLALGGGYFVLFLVNPQGMGFGDVKLAFALGAVLGWYGWGVLLLGTFAGFLFGALYGLGLVVARRAGRKTSIPFGPFLIGGAFVGVLLGAWAA